MSQNASEVGDVETKIEECREAGSHQHEALRHRFARLGRKLRDLGDVIVFLGGYVEALAPCTPPAKIVELVKKDPAKFCVFRVNPCGGPPAQFKDGDRLEEGDELVVSLCVPPADGADRAQVLASDVALLSRVARNVRVVRLREGQEALLGDFSVTPGDAATAGVVVSPLYPAAIPDWFLLDAKHDVTGFGGGKRGPYHEGELVVVEYSIHPPPGTTPSAAEYVLAVVARKLAQVRRVA